MASGAMAQQPLWIVAHRGGGGDPEPWQSPESSLLAFRRARELGVDAIECDVRVSADGVAFVIRDQTVDRTTDGTGRVADLTTAQLGELRLAGGERIPRLEQVLDEMCRAPADPCTLLCELKSRSCVAPVCQLMTAALLDSVQFLSFDWEVLADIRRRLPQARVSPVLDRPVAGQIRRARKLGAASVDALHSWLTADFATMASRRGIALRVWTVDDPRLLPRLLGLGVTDVTTNRPAALLRWLGRLTPYKGGL